MYGNIYQPFEFKKTLLEDFDEGGYWWRPENPNDKLYGHIILKNGRLLFKLNGQFSTNPNQLVYPLLHGQCANGSNFTIIQVAERQSQIVGKSYPTRSLKPLCVISDTHCTEHDEFDYSATRFPELEQTLGNVPFASRTISNEKTEWTWTPPNEFKISLTDISSFLELTNLRQSERTHTEIKQSYQSLFGLHPDLPKNLWWHIEHLDKLRRYFTVLTGTPIPYEEVYLYREKIRLRIYFEQAFVNMTSDDFQRLIVPRNLSPAIFQNSVSNWFAFEKQLELITKLFCDFIQLGPQYPHSALVDLAQLLEAYHRSVSIGEYISKDDYEVIWSHLIEQIPSANVSNDLKQRIKKGLQYCYQYSQRKRIRELTENLPDEIRNLIFNNIPDFLQRVIDTRNYVIHRDPESQENILNEEDAKIANFGLFFLLYSSLLVKIGIPATTICHGIKTSFKYVIYNKLKKW